MEGNGRITINYNIELKSHTKTKEILLHLVPIQISEADMYKEMYRKMKEEKDKME